MSRTAEAAELAEPGQFRNHRIADLSVLRGREL